mgnify:CR=1 FL=1
MNRFNFSLKEFWDRCMEPVYNADTGKQINSKEMLENKDLQVLLFWAHFVDGIYEGISVKLENEDMEG